MRPMLSAAVVSVAARLFVAIMKIDGEAHKRRGAIRSGWRNACMRRIIVAVKSAVFGILLA